MPKPPRTPQEVEAFRENILAHAVELISAKGFEGFSMRKLSARLGIAAKTIYNYYTNKDELYLAILTKGFNRLHRQCEKARDSQDEPLDRIEAMVSAFLDFGLNESHAYNLMFTWHVPKYNDYVGSDMEPAALLELQAALKMVDLFVDAIGACASPGFFIREEDARKVLISIFTRLHGFIASYNNTLLQYMHSGPMDLVPGMREEIREDFLRRLERIQLPERSLSTA
ncbi:transcriptional regulator, TetR family [Desulfatibacillum alkenivorans DSM 16219]|jgi:AcrR family transcriptional regulator|uniref:Transcriptional regulator, TetR family n=1 Tax=Desulfatibacillum alkenivorans DSM 16219 TaxID=1121393 RepID=A0A1M6VPE6_9BACT|nr:TetR/AcrR family transcriptional regulator [Desulfatibacillum alkenivorans]SHK83211.1 transcriptional regulator, TetR family [Desulfatibacillum alkenivorans DSM 16219]